MTNPCTGAVGFSVWLFALHWILWQQKCVGVTLTLRIFRLWQACLVMQFQRTDLVVPFSSLLSFPFVCLSAAERDSGQVTDTSSKGTPTHNRCGVTRAVLYAALWLFWFGEEKAEPWTPSWQLSSNQRSPASRRETAAIVHRLCRVFVLA